MSRHVFVEIDALLKRILALEHRTTFGGGGVPPGAHAVNHADGGSDELDITTLAGFPGDSSLVLRGDGTFGSVAGAGVGQWIPTAVDNGLMLLNAEGHPVLVWWDGP